MKSFQDRLTTLRSRQEALVATPNGVDPDWYNGIYERSAECVRQLLALDPTAPGPADRLTNGCRLVATLG
jgi:hypothetical protein